MATTSLFQNQVSKKNASRDLFFVLVILSLVFIMAARTPLDQDMWWHIRAGETTLQLGHPLLTDIFSFTRSGVAWTNHSWLSQVVLYALYQIGSYYALTILVAILITLSFWLVLRQMDCPVLLRGFVAIIAAVVASPVWIPRPELVSLVMTATFGYILYLYKWRKIDRIWWLVPIVAVWSNLHGGYAIGFIMLICMIVGEIANHLLGFDRGETLSYLHIRKLILVMGAGALAVLINPNGIRTWLVPFQTVGVEALQKYIQEWASPDFHMLGQQPFIWMLLACLAAIGLSGRKLDGTDFVTLGGFTYMSLLARRNFGPFALVAAPILARYLWFALQSWWERIGPGLRTEVERFSLPRQLLSGSLKNQPKYGKAINLSFIAILTIVAIVRVYSVSIPEAIQPQADELFPVKAVEWIDQNHPAGKLFNSYNWGGYLIWALRDYPVFLDGRTDLFKDEIINQWIEVVNAEDGWQQVLDQWGIHLILLEPHWAVVQILPENGWKILYQDDTAIVFGR